MRTISEDVLHDLSGSREGDSLDVSVWYDGTLVMPALDLATWKINWDASRDVQGQLTLSSVNIPPKLMPWADEDHLGVAGPRLKVGLRDGLHDEVTRLGWWRLWVSEPRESWMIPVQRENGIVTGLAPVQQWRLDSGSVDIEGEELTKELLGPGIHETETPVEKTVIAEVRRLTNGIITIGETLGVVDKNIPASVTYNSTRLAAIKTLLGVIDARPRMSQDGLMDIIPTTPPEPVWEIQPGQYGILIALKRKYTADNIVNEVISTGRTDDSAPLIGRARITTGPLRYGGPAGMVTREHQALATTQQGVTQDAQSILDNYVRDRTNTITITCAPNPALELWDRVTLTIPGGQLVGDVVNITLSGSVEGIDPMVIDVNVSPGALAMVRDELLART